MRVEHEYGRAGAWAYLAALDVHRAKVFGRCEATTGIAPFARLVNQVMSQPPYNEARKVFWVMDNGSSHRGESSVQRLTRRSPGSRNTPMPDKNLRIESKAKKVTVEESIQFPIHDRMQAMGTTRRGIAAGTLLGSLLLLSGCVSGAARTHAEGVGLGAAAVMAYNRETKYALDQLEWQKAMILRSLGR